MWSRGLVTITSDRPPLSVGLSDASLNEWEDLCDLDGNPTGVEVMELNIRSEPNRITMVSFANYVEFISPLSLLYTSVHVQ